MSRRVYLTRKGQYSSPTMFICEQFSIYTNIKAKRGKTVLTYTLICVLLENIMGNKLVLEQ
jgi:hypothetical protein